MWEHWELRSALGPKVRLCMGLIKEEEFIFCLRAAGTSRSGAVGVLSRNGAHATPKHQGAT